MGQGGVPTTSVMPCAHMRNKMKYSSSFPPLGQFGVLGEQEDPEYDF